MPPPTRPAPLFPLDPWCIRESGFDPAQHGLSETLFALGNGYIGLRGTGEEGYAGAAGASHDGSYLNGFYECEPIRYPEAAFGLARTNEFMLKVPNAKGIALWIDGERFDLQAGTVEAYERRLDFRTGVLVRRVQWRSPAGKQVVIDSRRLVSFTHKHLFAIEWRVTATEAGCRVRLESSVDGAVRNLQAGDDPRVGSAASGCALQLLAQVQRDSAAAIVQCTHNSGFTLVSAIDNTLACPGAFKQAPLQGEHRSGHAFETELQAGERACLTKYGVYFSSRDYAQAELQQRAFDELARARSTGMTELEAQQAQYLADYWQQADVEIAGDDALQQGMRFNQFHLLQSVGRDGKTNIAAKGVTGEGYEGHYFWDTEIYIFPFFLYSKPEVARSLLDYRYRGLPKARERARQMAHAKGALYPWRTIAGEECSAYFPAGTAQYHINADIAYSIKLYFEATGDVDYMLEAGAEIVLETARIWPGLGHFNRDGCFCINTVTGPDEYTALVNNNYYTNAMARMHLQFAAALCERLGASHPQEFARIARAIGLGADEAHEWRRAAAAMLLPYDEALGIHAQDDSFLSKRRWDFDATPDDKYPLLLNYHPMVIYRHQVCKQADVVLALLLLADQFTLEDKRRDFCYYEAVTTHDSSLSSCIFSIIASEVGFHDKAYDYFMETARLDLDDTHGNTHYGVHTAAMAGTWMGVAYGFAGMRVVDGELRFAPTLPAQWQHYQFKIHLHGALLQVRVEQQAALYTLVAGESLAFSHGGERIVLSPAQPSVRVAMLGEPS